MVGMFSLVFKKACSCKPVQALHSRYVFAIYLCMVFVVCLVSVHVPMSLMYKQFHNDTFSLMFANQINSARYDQAMHYFRSVASSGRSDRHYSAPTASGQLVICIVTVDRTKQYVLDREKMGYLIQAAASLDYLVKNDKYFHDTVLFICNVEQSPSDHRDAEYLKPFLPYVERYGSNSFKRKFPSVIDYVQRHSSFQRGKELEDYIFCLNASHSLGSPYILMLEDDIIAMKDIFRVLNHTLISHNLISEYSINGPVQRRKYSYLKLYYPLKWQGYAFELDRMLELFCVGCLGGSLLALCSYISHRGNSNYSIKFSHFILGGALTVVCVLVFGRQNLLELRRLSPHLFRFTRSPGCCTPAMLYPREIVQNLTNYLIAHSQMNKDLAIAAFAEESQVPGYYLEPNLAYHIGLYTSLKRAYKPPEEFLYNVPLY